MVQEISISDIINIKILKSSGGIQLSSKGLTVDCPDIQNTCYKITNYIKKNYKIENQIIIELHKKIPIGSGLGGGSSNAACILNFLDKTLKINLSKEKKAEICKSIGMDVPFFIDGGLQYVEGMGDITNMLPPLFENNFIIIVMPQFSISTKWAYSKIKKELPAKKIKYNLRALSTSIKWSAFGNDFEDIVIPIYPEIRNIKDLFNKSNAIFSSLSGSGSTIFGVYKDLNLAKKANQLMQDLEYQSVVAKPNI